MSRTRRTAMICVRDVVIEPVTLIVDRRNVSRGRWGSSRARMMSSGVMREVVIEDVAFIVER
jgi:hypothetical protein